MNKTELDKILKHHKTWLKGKGGIRAELSYTDLPLQNLSGADLSRANLSHVNLVGASLSGANLSGADITFAILSEVNLTGANLSGADLSGSSLFRTNLTGANLTKTNLSGVDLNEAILPGYKNIQPESLEDAIDKTRSWLADGHWTQNKWIETPDGAYAGTCLACLHGAVNYIGGKFGPQLSYLLCVNGYTIGWNDKPEITLKDVIAALDDVKAKI
jgi:hypothetical protein